MIRAAELFFPAIRWDADKGYEQSREGIDAALRLGVGGFIIFGGPFEEVASLTGHLHSSSPHPLLVGSDLERGAGQQFAGLTALPPLAAIASLGDMEVVRESAALTAREARQAGVNWVYAPDCDLDVEPDNPIVGTRSFGSDPQRVSEMAVAWITSCQSEKALACAKHFPGHGRTTGDSHKELPSVGASEAELSGADLVPFRGAIAAGVASMMSAHVSFPSLDPSGAPATLSRPILTDLLRNRLGFDGLIVTDALIMEGVLGGGEREAVVRAVEAGCDCLLYPTDLEGAIGAIEQALSSGGLSEDAVASAVARRRKWAEWAKLTSPTAQSPASPWAADIALRTVHMVRGNAPRIGESVELITVDDDIGGPYPPPSRDTFADALRQGGLNVARASSPSRSASSSASPPSPALPPAPVSRIIALYGDIRAWKGRPGYSPATIATVDGLLQDGAATETLIVEFSHPRLTAQIPGSGPVLCAWGGEAVMQRAAAEKVLSMSRTQPG